MPNKPYDNFFLANEIEDQYNSHLDLVQFCTVDNSLTGTAGMDYKVHVYKATDGTEKLTKGEGNTKTIEADFTEKVYKILLAQNRFSYFDEDAMTDPMVVTTGTRHAGVDLFNTQNADMPIFRRLLKRYKDTGEDIYFDIQCTNEDPTSSVGRQTVILKGCNMDGGILAKFDADAEYIDEDMDFTFEDFEIPENFTLLDGMQ